MMPYAFKSKVLEAMMVSSILYGSETWLSGSVKEIEKMYVSAVKSALGVRDTTRNDAALIEAGRPSVQELVAKRTTNFMKKELFADRTVDTPLMKIFKICESKRTNGYTYLSRLLDPSRHHNVTVIERFITQNTSKAATYKQINPNLSVHSIYTTDKYVDERKRLVFTRFRLSSHRLKIETGRWARIEAQNRVCDCGGGIQDESHVLFECPKTNGERALYRVDGANTDIGVLMGSMNVHELVPFVYNCMQHFT